MRGRRLLSRVFSARRLGDLGAFSAGFYLGRAIWQGDAAEIVAGCVLFVVAAGLRVWIRVSS